MTDSNYPVDVACRQRKPLSKDPLFGYDSSYDELRECDDIVPLTSTDIAETELTIGIALLSLCE